MGRTFESRKHRYQWANGYKILGPNWNGLRSEKSPILWLPGKTTFLTHITVSGKTVVTELE